MKTNAVLVAIIIVLTAIASGGAMYIYMDSQKNENNKNNTGIITPTTSIISTSPQPSPPPTTPLPAGWKKYINEEYGFSISYPSSYNALTDSNNLYAWPNAVVLFYNGGQSYDIAVEVWTSTSAYQTKLAGHTYSVHEIDGKFITLTSLTEETQNPQIIETFEKLQ